MADVENFEAHLFISSLYNDDWCKFGEISLIYFQFSEWWVKMVAEVEARFYEGLRRLVWVENQYFHMVRSSGSFGYDELLHVAAIKEALYAEIERKRGCLDETLFLDAEYE